MVKLKHALTFCDNNLIYIFYHILLLSTLLLPRPFIVNSMMYRKFDNVYLLMRMRSPSVNPGPQYSENLYYYY